MTDAAFALFQQAHAAAAAARKAYDDACDADASDSRLALLRERAEHAERARDVARDVYVASRGPSSDDSTLIVGDWFLVAARDVIAHAYALFRHPGPDRPQLGSSANSPERRHRQHASELGPISVRDDRNSRAVPVPLSGVQTAPLRAVELRHRANRPSPQDYKHHQ
ncbi:Uncharacterized protein PBTT_10375 [Plasmodiophora brassicae]